MAGTNKKDWIEENPNTVKAIAVGGGLLLLYDILIQPILEALGIVKSDAEKNIDAAMVDPKNAFNPNYWQTIPLSAQSRIMSHNDIMSIAWTIYNSVGLSNDDFNSMFGAVKKLQTKADVSFLAYTFNDQQMGGDLLTWLLGTNMWPNDHFSADQVNTVLEYVNKLPNY